MKIIRQRKLNDLIMLCIQTISWVDFSQYIIQEQSKLLYSYASKGPSITLS